MYRISVALAELLRRKAFLRPLIMICAILLLPCVMATAAVQSNSTGMDKTGSPNPPPGAIQALSGSPYPGVIDCLLQRPLQGEGNGARGDIHINYPSFGNKPVDEDIRDWVTGMAEAFSNHLSLPGEDATTEVDALIDSVLNDELLPGEAAQPVQYELWGGYKVSRPSDAAVSIAFELWNYTGAPEGNLDILTLNYSLLTGQRLELVDIFEKPDVALELMSAWSRKVLEPRLGAARRARMLAEGTAPLMENFSSFMLTPEGICINFQPWQVAPQDAGIQKVLMPLKELMPSAPLLALWGKGEHNEQAGTD